MMVWMLKSKIHGAKVTFSNIDYEGSITIDKNLMKAANLLPGERVQVLNVNNGERFETYVIPGKKGQIGLNGAAARKGNVGDKLLILSYVLVNFEEAGKFKAKILILGEENEIVKIREGV